jgi:predicted metal-binding protein
MIMDILNTLSQNAVKCGFTATGLIKTGELNFYPEIRNICQENTCRGYGKTWACPPAVGTLEQCQARVMQYENMLLFSQIFRLEDSFDFEGMHDGMMRFKQTVDRFAEAIKPLVSNGLILSNEGCGRCKVCTYPDAPCRFPDKLYPSIEGFGFIVSELANQAGIKYNNGPNTVTFFGAVVY